MGIPSDSDGEHMRARLSGRRRVLINQRHVPDGSLRRAATRV